MDKPKDVSPEPKWWNLLKEAIQEEMKKQKKPQKKNSEKRLQELDLIGEESGNGGTSR